MPCSHRWRLPGGHHPSSYACWMGPGGLAALLVAAGRRPCGAEVSCRWTHPWCCFLHQGYRTYRKERRPTPAHATPAFPSSLNSVFPCSPLALPAHQPSFWTSRVPPWVCACVAVYPRGLSLSRRQAAVPLLLQRHYAAELGVWCEMGVWFIMAWRMFGRCLHGI